MREHGSTRLTRAAWLLVPWIAALVLTGGCGHSGSSSAASTSGGPTSASSSGTGGAPSCGLPGSANGECASCLTSHCCAELDACEAQPACKAGLDCRASCNFDPDCSIPQCAKFAMSPTPNGLAVDECGLTSCSAECAGYMQGCKNLTTALGATCGMCLQTNCCDAFTADPESVDYTKCRLECADAACLYSCETSHPNAIAKLNAEGACVVDGCKTQCAQPGGCGVFLSQGACGTCIHDQCCAQHEACSKDASCTDLFSCLQSCTPGVDCDACLEAWPSKEIGLAMSMLNCTTTTCKDSCGGNGCGLYDSSLAMNCQTCVQASCCAESTACGLDADCVALEVCVELCKGDSVCLAKCKSNLPNGAMLFDPLVMCEATKCPACG